MAAAAVRFQEPHRCGLTMSGQPRVDRELLRWVWRQSNTHEGYQAWRQRNLREMAESKQVEEERQRQLHGPWSMEEWTNWEKLQREAELEVEAQRISREAAEMADVELNKTLEAAIKRHKTNFQKMKDEQSGDADSQTALGSVTADSSQKAKGEADNDA